VLVSAREGLRAAFGLEQVIAGEIFGKFVPDQTSNATIILHYEDGAGPLHNVALGLPIFKRSQLIASAKHERPQAATTAARSINCTGANCEH